MPRVSLHMEILQVLDAATIAVAEKRNEEISASFNSSNSELTKTWTDTSSKSSSRSDSLMLISPPSPVLLTSSMSLNSESMDTVSTTEAVAAPYMDLLCALLVLCDRVKTTRVLEYPDEPLPRASQLHLLHHAAEHHPVQFRQKLHINPLIFDDILDQISDHTIFQNWSNNKQLPVAIQLAVFLFRAGHYGNACTPEDVTQWAGISVGMVVNCTRHVMATILDQHDEFIYTPDVCSEDMCRVQEFTESWTCCVWRNGAFAADGTAVSLYAVSQSVDFGRNNNPNTTPTKDYKIVRVVVYLRSV